MKLRRLILKNFRKYKLLELDFNDNMNVIIGKNDIGKSSIMEALEIFFNGDKKDAIVKPEIGDCNINSEEKEMVIGVCFELNEEEKIVIDSTYPTCLKEEFLLNKEGLLEIHKVWNCSNSTLRTTDLKIYIIANYPTIFETPLITLKNKELKTYLQDIKDNFDNYNEVNKSTNACIRKALYDYYLKQDTQFREIPIEINKIQSNDKNTWDKIKSNFPLYFLFQSDRTNSDSDSEVQNPLKIATQKALEEIKEKIEEIKQYVDEKVSQIGDETIEKLKDFDSDIAKKLKTNLKEKSWHSIFSFELESDDGIPLNKRGSGIKRLILLSYFRAEAERISKEKNIVDIIYAIEEPETSQHPNFQKMIMESLLEISADTKHQIIVTTHTPEIAKMVDKESLIFLTANDNNDTIVVKDEEVKLKGIAKTLGVLPTVESKVVVCVEGENDVTFLKNINQSIDEFKEIIDLEQEQISIIPLGGSKLIQWVNKNYLENSNVIEFHLYDGDRDDYKKKIEQIKLESDGRRFGEITFRREMENYIPMSLIEEEFNIDMSQFKEEWNNFDLCKYLVGIVKLEIECPKKREEVIKRIINGKLSKKVTYELLKQDGSYDEIKSWFEQINYLYNK